MPRIPVTLQFTRGVNLFNRSRDLTDGEFRSAKNLYPSSPRKLKTRPALAGERYFQDAGATDGFPIWAGWAPRPSETDLVMIYRSVADGVNTKIRAFSDVDGAAVDADLSADMGTPTQYRPAVLYFQDGIYFFGGAGSNSNGKVLRRTTIDPNSPYELADFAFTDAATNGALRPQAVGLYNNRVAYGNFGPGFESALVFADPNEPNSIPDDALNSDYFLVNPEEPSRIVTMTQLIQTGASAAALSFLILKENSSVLMTGDPLFADGSGTDTVQMNTMPIGAGCSSPDTLVRTPFGIIWTGPDDIWLFPEGQLPKRIGTKIRPALEATPADKRYLWHAGYSNGFYRLALFAAGAGPSDESMCSEQYWLDLRAGAPNDWQSAMWWGPQAYKSQLRPGAGTYSPKEGTAFMFDGAPAGIAAKELRALVTDINGYSAICTLGSQTSHDLYRDTVYGTLGTVDSSDVAIQPELMTGEIAQLASGEQLVADDVQEKGFLGAELDLMTSASGILAWQWILNGGLAVGALQSAELAAAGFQLSVSEVGNELLSEYRGNIALDPAPERVVGKTFQLKLYPKTGFFIDATNDTFSMDITVSGVTVRVNTTITGGYYPNNAALLAQIQSQFNTALSAVFPLIIMEALTDAANGLNYFQFTPPVDAVEYSSASVAVGPDSARALAELLGFIDWSGAGYTAQPVLATNTVYSTDVPLLELESAVMWFYVVNRRSL